MNKALEDLQSGRDPFARPDNSASNSEFHYQAARWSLWLPIVAASLCKGVASATQEVQGDTRRWIYLGAGGVFLLLILGSLVTGIIALCGISGSGRQGILGRAVFGLAASGVLLFIFGDGVRHGYQSAVMARTLEESGNKLKADMRKEVESGQGISLDKQTQRLDGIIQTVDAASQNSSGDAALFAKAAGAFLSRLQTEVRIYAAAVKPIQDPALLDLSGVKRREQLEERKDVVRKFLAANERLLAFTTNQEIVFREELEKLPLAPAARESALKGYHKSAASQQSVKEGIRNDDRRCGVALLGMLDLLDANWGKWTWNADRMKVAFDSDAAQDKFIGYRDEIQAAAREQTKLQMQLLKEKAPSR